MDTLENRHIGEFVLVEQIGGSAAGVVYRAYQPSINRHVALKLIDVPTDVRADKALSFEQRFVQEAQVMASLEHPHIVPLYHYGIVGDEHAYIAMRLMTQSLADMLADGPLTADRATDIALQVLDGLDYAHRNGVIHRDIKPNNILFDEAGSACLADFGQARLITQTLDLKLSPLLRESAAYISPEQIRSTSMDHRCDIYSIGVVLYQMLTGRVPFEDENGSFLSLLRRIELEEPVAPRTLNPDIPAALEQVILQALRKEPRERFFDVQEMISALEATSSTQNRPRKPRVLPSQKGIRRRSPWLRFRRYQFAAAAFLVTGILIALIVFANTSSRLREPPQRTTVLVSTRGSLEDAVPTSAEAAQARLSLGNTGLIAYISCALDSQFETERANDLTSRAAQYGVNVRVYDSGNDAYKQLTLIEQARIDNARAIILCPLKPKALADSLDSLHDADIPFVLTDYVDNSGGVTLDPHDNAIGALAGQFIGETVATASGEKPNVVILDEPNYAFSQARVDGFVEGLHETLPGAQVIGQFPTAADQAASQSAISGLIAKGQRIDAVFSIMDAGAYGAISALDAAGIDRSAVPVVSVNAESRALSATYNRDFLRASIDIAGRQGSQAALDAAVKLLGGGTLPEVLELPPGVLITRDIIQEQTSSQH